VLQDCSCLDIERLKVPKVTNTPTVTILPKKQQNFKALDKCEGSNPPKTIDALKVVDKYRFLWRKEN